MSASILSGRQSMPKRESERKKRQRQRADVEAIPPELLLRRDSSVRYERNGPVYATDGKVGVLKKVVVDESAGEVVELAVQVDGEDRMILIPPDVVDKSAGSALFLTVNRVQFSERAAAGPAFVKSHFARVDVKSLLKREGRGGANPRRAVASAGGDFVETPSASPLDRLQRRTEAAAD